MRCHICFADMDVRWTPGTLFRRVWLCSTCESALQPVTGGCLACGHPCEGSYCRDCRRWLALGLSLHTKTLFYYDRTGAEWMHRFKFFGDAVLFEALKPSLQVLAVPGVMYVPVPLSQERLAERRFNQAEVIARMIGPTRELLFKEETVSQRVFGKTGRRTRANPFRLREQRPSGRVVLVDDVYTTGTTLQQAALTLRNGGWDVVGAICLFRALRDGSDEKL